MRALYPILSSPSLFKLRWFCFLFWCGGPTPQKNTPERKDHPQRVSGDLSGIRKYFKKIPCGVYYWLSFFFHLWYPQIRINICQCLLPFFCFDKWLLKLNTDDFIEEIISSLRFFVDYIRGKPFTRSPREGDNANFGEAFGVATTKEQPLPVKQMAPEVSAEQAVLLEPYPFSSTKNGDV